MKKIFSNRLKFLILFSLSLFVNLHTGCGGSSPDIVKLKSEINSQMDAMISTLNSADYSKFLRDFVDPFYITKSGGLDQMLQDFNSEKQVEIFTALELAKNVEPLYSNTSQKMTYVGIGLTSPVTFQKIDGIWYLSGESFETKTK